MSAPIIHKLELTSDSVSMVENIIKLEPPQSPQAEPEHSSGRGTISCNLCGRKFNRRCTMDAHITKVHKIKPRCDLKYVHQSMEIESENSDDEELYCTVCGRNFKRKISLYKHIRRVHQVNPHCSVNIFPGSLKDKSCSAVYSCCICGQKFMRECNLQKHLENVHTVDPNDPNYFKVEIVDNDDSDSNPFSCQACGKRFISNHILYLHLRRIHKVEATITFSIRCPVERCQTQVSSHPMLRQHLQSQHKIDCQKVELDFPTEEEFLEWKKSIESDGFKYVKRTAVRLQDGRKKTYLRCHRSGIFVSESTGRRAPRYHGSCRMNFHCPSTVEVMQGTSIRVTFYPTHVGHGKELRAPNCRNKKIRNFCGEFLGNMPLEKCLDVVQNSLNGRLRRIQSVAMRELQLCSVREPPLEKCHNYYIDVDSYLKENESLGNQSPVIYYEPGSATSNLPEDDFLLILMTPCQKEMLDLFGSKFLCIDSVHSGESNDFHLTTMSVIDEFQVSYPVGFCISHRLDNYHMDIYFNAIYEMFGQVFTRHFMSDDSVLYFNAWKKVMPLPKKKLLCSWDVDKYWRQSLSNIIPFEKKINAYKQLCMLMEEADAEAFNTLQKEFMQDLEKDNDTKDFGSHYKFTYSWRKKEWAYCYRPKVDINAHISLEALHMVFNSIYQREKNCKKIDMFISQLMKIVHQKTQDRYKKLIEDNDREITSIEHEHAKGMDIDREAISYLVGKKWEVNEENYESSQLTRISKRKCENCRIVCTVCEICIHMYSCDCPIYKVHATICRHVHAVHMTDNTSKLITSIHKVQDREALVEHMENLEKPDNRDMEAKLLGALNTIKIKPFSAEKRRRMIMLLDSVIDLIGEQPSAAKENDYPTNKKRKH